MHGAEKFRMETTFSKATTGWAVHGPIRFVLMLAIAGALGAGLFAANMPANAEAGQGDRERSQAQLLDEVGKGWQRPGIYQERAPGLAMDAKLTPLAQKLERIILPSVSFTRVELARVVTTLSAASEEFDLAGPEPRGVNIVLIDPGNKAPAISITLRNLSLKRVLD